MLLEVDDIRGVKPFVLDVLQRPPKRFMKALHRIVHLNPSRGNGVSFIKGLNKNPPTSQDRYLDFVSNHHFFVPVFTFRWASSLCPTPTQGKRFVLFLFPPGNRQKLCSFLRLSFRFSTNRRRQNLNNCNTNRLKLPINSISIRIIRILTSWVRLSTENSTESGGR